MLLDCCEGVRGELLQRSIVAPFGIAFKKLEAKATKSGQWEQLQLARLKVLAKAF